MKITIDKFLKDNLACLQAITWLRRYSDVKKAWVECPRADWMLWAISCYPAVQKRIGKRVFVVLALRFAERALPHFEKWSPTDKKPRNAILLVKKWLKNPRAVSHNDLSVAVSAMSAATDAVASAMYVTDAAADAAELKWQADQIRKLIPCPFNES